MAIDLNSMNNSLEAQLRSQLAQMNPGSHRTATSFNPTLSETRIEKTKLMEVLKLNLDKHRTEYETAMTDYWEALEIYHTAQLARAKSKNKIGMDVPAPQAPTSQVKEYEKVIRQLELSVDNQFTLTENQFQTYVMDDWFWKHAFAANNQTLAMYKTLDRSAGIR